MLRNPFSYSDNSGATPVDMVELHIDALSAAVKFSDTVELKRSVRVTTNPIEFDAETGLCKHGHTKSVCLCHKPRLHHLGQDECVYHAYLHSSKTWYVQEIVGLYKKGQGKGVMVSAFVSEQVGFGLKIAVDQLEAVNAVRAKYEREPLDADSLCTLFDYGKNKKGYWNYEHFALQVQDVMDVWEACYPEEQILFEVDWSAGHAKKADDALQTGATAVKVNCHPRKEGETIMRKTRLTEGCIGTLPAIKTTNTEEVYNYGLNVGDYQYFEHMHGDPPPFYDVDCEPGAYEGHVKGLKQILFERRLWESDLVGSVTKKNVKKYRGLSECGCADNKAISKCCRKFEMRHRLAALPDFAAQRGALAELINARGHIVIFSPKCHPEIAGNGIEYLWGVSKKVFRRRINDFENKHLHANVKKALATEDIVDKNGEVLKAPLSKERVYRFARKTRTYRRLYELFPTPADLKVAGEVGTVSEGEWFRQIEKHYKKTSTHRNILDSEGAYLKELLK